MTDPAKLVEMLTNDRIFRMPEGTDYLFVMPGVSLGGQNITEEMIDGKWRLTQVVDGRTYVAEHDYRQAAVLLLIAARMGFAGVLHESEPA